MMELEPDDDRLHRRGRAAGRCASLGVRFAFAGAIVGTAGLTMLIGWDAGIRTAGIAPYTPRAPTTRCRVLPMFILIGYLAYYAGITQTRLRGGATLVRLAAGRARHRHGVRGRGLLGGVGREQRRRRGVRQGGDPRDAAGEVRQAPGGRRLRGRRHARFADPAQHAAGRLRHHHRAVDRQAADRGLRARHRLGASSTPRSSPGAAGATRSSARASAATPGRSASSRCPARRRSSWSS